MTRAIPNLLSIAGSDPSGGAGIQADLKTFAAWRCHGMAVITALTAQNTAGVGAIHLPPPEFVGHQIKMIFDDIEVAAIKTGMLGSAAIVRAIAGALRRFDSIPLVLDPVLASTSGSELGDEGMIDAMRTHLFARATLITPNLAEAARILGSVPPQSRDEIASMAQQLYAQGATAWLIKGGHGGGDTSDDLLYDGTSFQWFSSRRIETQNTHGTGCTLSSAIAASLAGGALLPDAVRQAKAYLTAALEGADGLAVGKGAGPVDHFAAWRGKDEPKPTPSAPRSSRRSS